MRMKNLSTTEVDQDGVKLYQLLSAVQETHKVEGRSYEDKLTHRPSLEFIKQEDGTWLREELGSIKHTLISLTIMYLITLLGN